MAIDVNLHRAAAMPVRENVGVERPASTAAMGADFAQAISRNVPEGLIRKHHSISSVQAPSRASQPLNDLSNYLAGRNHAVTQMMDKVLRTGNPHEMMQATSVLIDGGVETDLVAKVIGKTISAVDQLTKLS